MKVSGIWKLRIAVTALFLVTVTSIVITFPAVEMDSEADMTFYERLTDEDITDLERIYMKYPETDTDGIYQFAGLLVYLLAALLFFLMIKVYQIKEIN